MTFWWKDRRWYRHLIPNGTDKALLNDIYYEEALDGLIMAREDPYRSFALFKNHAEFIQFFLKLAPNEKSFHEVILRDTSFKMYFDLDVAKENDLILYRREGCSILAQIVAAVEKVYWDNYHINLNLNRDFIWLCGSRTEKVSLHLIIDNYRVSNYREAKHLFQLVMAELPERYHSFFDAGVYIPNKTFRILGGTKFDRPECPLTFLDNWVCGSDLVRYHYPVELVGQIHFSLQYQASLITVAMHCQLLRSLLTEAVPAPTNVTYIDDDMTQKILAQLAQWENVDLIDLPYHLSSVEKNQLRFTRLKPSWCRSCSRIHEAENPYVTVNVKGDTLNISFHCRRGPSQLIGKLIDTYHGGEENRLHVVGRLGFKMQFQEREISVSQTVK